MSVCDFRLGAVETITGRVQTLDATNGRDDDDPHFALLPDGELLVTLHVNLEEQGPRSLTWADMGQLQVGSVVLFDGRPFQKMSQVAAVAGGCVQHWVGPGSALLFSQAVDCGANGPAQLLWAATEAAAATGAVSR